MEPWTSEHIKWLVDTGEKLKTATQPICLPDTKPDAIPQTAWTGKF